MKRKNNMDENSSFHLPDLNVDLNVVDQPQPQPQPQPSRAPKTPRRPRGRAPGSTNTTTTSVVAATPLHSISYMLEHGIKNREGKVGCKKCEKSFDVSYDMAEKFEEIKNFVMKNEGHFHNRAPKEWTSPKLLNCIFCGANQSCKPVLDAKDFEKIDWLFLFLGQFVGVCTLEQLKYFCKANKVHCTGAKDRLIFSTYMDICTKLEPNFPLFH